MKPGELRPARVKVTPQGIARGLIRGVAVDVTPWLKNDPCVYCGGPGGTKEHVTPRSAGGSNHSWNLASACASCNRERSSTPLLTFLLSRAA